MCHRSRPAVTHTTRPPGSDAAFAGRAYAAYGGVYIVSSLVWLALVEQTKPRMTDILGAVLCLAGAAAILYGSRWTSA